MWGLQILGETKGRVEKPLAVLGAEFAVGAAILAAVVDLAVDGFDAADVKLLVAASAAVADFGPQGSLMLPALLSVLVHLALWAYVFLYYLYFPVLIRF